MSKKQNKEKVVVVPAKVPKRTRRKTKAKEIRKEVKQAMTGESAGAKSDRMSLAGYAKGVSRFSKASWVEKRGAQYLMGLYNPSLVNMPGSLTGLAPGMPTQIYSYEFTGTMVANANGFCFVGLESDGWITDNTAVGNYRGPYNSTTQFLGSTTNGEICWYSNASYVGTALPPGLSTTTTAGLLPASTMGAATSISSFAPGATGQTRYRMVSASLECFPVGTQTGTSGEILGWRQRNHDYQPASGPGVAAAKTFSQLSGVPNSVADVEIQSLSNWKSGTVSRLLMLPSTRVAYEFLICPAVAKASTGAFALAFVGSGLQPNQPVQFTAVINYELTAVPTYLASSGQQMGEAEAFVAPPPPPSHPLLGKYHPSIVNVPKQAVNSAAPLQVMAASKALQEAPMAKSEQKSWLSDVGSAIQTGASIASGVSKGLEAFESIMSMF